MLDNSFQNKIRFGKDATASDAKFEREFERERDGGGSDITKVSRSWLAQGRQSKRANLSVRPTGDVVIYCWPYHAVDAEETPSFRIKSSKKDPIVWVVSIFGSIWLLSTLIMLGSLSGFHNFSGCWYLFKLVPLLLLPLFGMMKGLTHIRIAYDGVVLQSSSGKSTLRSKSLLWHNIRRVYVQPAGNEKDLLSGKLVFDTSKGTTKIALRKIGSAAQWRKLVGALSGRVRDCDLDPALLDGINRDRNSDPTYTKIWLEALTAPPLRERLQPLTQGVELQKGLYRIESCLGSGGQGSAYLVSTQGEKLVLKEYILPVYVDVKVKRKALEDFEHESRIMRSLNHDGIVKTRGSFVEDHRAYLILEYVSGKSLKDLVEEHGLFSEADCVRFGIQMCDILNYLHSQSPPVVHQDFTPDNLLLSADRSLKLIDFMVAKQSDTEFSSASSSASASSSSSSSSNAVVGKHHYMPPEQFRGRATTRSDIYALGCTLHYILTGCKPEPMSTSHPTLQNESVSGAMTSIVEQATTLDEKLRYQNVLVMKDDLHRLLASSRLTD